MNNSWFGWSQSTWEAIGTWGIVAFTIWEGYFLWRQNKDIWQAKSGQSVSNGWTLFFMAMATGTFMYAVNNHMRPMIFNALVLGLFNIPIAIGLGKFKGYQRWEIWFGFGLCIADGFMFFSHHQILWYFAWSIGAAVGLILIPWEIWQQKNAGVVNLGMLWVFFLSNAFWVIYGFAIGNWVLQWVTPFYVLILGVAIALWFKYPPTTKSLVL